MYSLEERKYIATTIIEQLGGNRFIAMTGAKDFIALEKGGVEFAIGRNSKKVNRVKITLEWDDTYTMQFVNYRAPKLVVNNKTLSADWKPEQRTVLNEVSGVYCDMLQDIFTENTHLYTSLGRPKNTDYER